MTTHAARVGNRPTYSHLDHLLDWLRDTPLRFAVLAVAAGLLVLAGGAATPVDQYFRPDDSVQAFLGGMWRLGHLLLAVAPVVALRSPVLALVVAVAPTPLALFGQHAWPFVGFVSLVAIAMVAVWSGPRRALAPAVVALAGIAVLASGRTIMVMPYGAEITFGYRGGRQGFDYAVLGVYCVSVALALGLAWWMRSSALLARRERAVADRSVQIEDEAAALGERARLARDLHDVVAHHVSLIAVRAETAPYTHPDLDASAKEVLADVAADARRALDELRGVLGVLRRADEAAPARNPQPTLADVASLVDAARDAGEDVTLTGDLDAAVGGAVGYAAYRVVQESLTNARRHALGRPVAVRVSADASRLLVHVENPAGGGRDSQHQPGHGLAGMRERVESLGGRFSAGHRGDLFVVEADLPGGAA